MHVMRIYARNACLCVCNVMRVCVHDCIYVKYAWCVCVCDVCMHACMHACLYCMSFMSVRTVCVYVCDVLYVCDVCTHARAYVYVCMSVCM